MSGSKAKKSGQEPWWHSYIQPVAAAVAALVVGGVVDHQINTNAAINHDGAQVVIQNAGGASSPSAVPAASISQQPPYTPPAQALAQYARPTSSWVTIADGAHISLNAMYNSVGLDPGRSFISAPPGTPINLGYNGIQTRGPGTVIDIRSPGK